MGFVSLLNLQRVTHLLLLFLGVLLVVVLVMINLMTSSYIFWWSTFVFMTIIFITINKEIVDCSSITNYFIIQEVLGLWFLVLVNSSTQFLVVSLKVGVAPLHFWVFSVLNSVGEWSLVWFLTFQKMPFFPVLLQVGSFLCFFILLVGVVICYVQMFVSKSFKNLFILSSTESFSWILLLMISSISGSLVLFLYYSFIMVFLIPLFFSNYINFLTWEVAIVFMNIPFSMNFFIKILVLGQLVYYEYFLLLMILFIMSLSIYSLGSLLVFLSVKNIKFSFWNVTPYFVFLPLMFMIMI
uniref:NADH dehydrogenase subunit 2 n=1 Tax=Ruizia karukerae TaxID=2201929 RepID=A0A343YNA6_9BILA|nr:NADH dehydrogenase subunit 2 [Ruizia karukerae]